MKLFSTAAISLMMIFLPLQVAMAAEAPTMPTMAIDPSGLIKGFDEPFVRFFESISNVAVSSSVESPRGYFDMSNTWLEEKIGMGWIELGKMIGEILIFVLTVVRTIIEAVLGFLKWLVSLV